MREDGQRQRRSERVRSAVVVLGLLTVSTGAARARADQAPQDPCRLRIACFNAENLAAPGEQTRLTRFRFEPARRRHLEHVAAVIETLAPDIVVLPEVVSRQGVDAIAAILADKGMRGYAGYHVDGSDAFTGFDVAVLSRVVPDEVDGARIHIHVPAKRSARGGKGRGDERPTGADGPTGGADDWMRATYTSVDDRGETREEVAVLQRHALAYFTVCGRKIALLGLHLKSNPSAVDANAQRTAETHIAREIIRRKIVAAGYLPVVLGDLNDYDPDVPMADGVRKTQTTVLRDLKNYDESTPGPELVNAAVFIPRVADRYTSHWDFNENGAPDGEDVFTMIDHVLLHRDLESAVVRAFICHATGLDVSDHFPVVVDLDLRK